MITAGDFRNGVTFEMDGNVYSIIEFQHVKPGKGAAFEKGKGHFPSSGWDGWFSMCRSLCSSSEMRASRERILFSSREMSNFWTS